MSSDLRGLEMSTQEKDSKSEKPSVARDYVYAGRRKTASGKSVGVIRQVVDGVLAADRLYEAKVLKGKVIGGLYRGASFHDGGSDKLKEASYVGYWKNAEDIIQWKALDDAFESEERQAKLESDAKKINEIEEIMLPLRKLYAGYNKRYDHAGKEALEKAVLRALRSAPRKAELE